MPSASYASPATATLSTYAALILSSLVIGYWIGTARSVLGYNSKLQRRAEQDDSDFDSEEETEVDLTDKTSVAAKAATADEGDFVPELDSTANSKGDTSSTKDSSPAAAMNRIALPNLWTECKMVLLVRTDLKMDKGKIAAQCSHATLACYKSSLHHNPKVVAQWERIGQAKIALKCPTEEELLRIEAEARKLGLVARSILDAGRTQIKAGTRTVLGIGPGPVKLIDQITGHLKLL